MLGVLLDENFTFQDNTDFLWTNLQIQSSF